MEIPNIKTMRKDYGRAKRMGYLNKPDTREAYALEVIPKKEYEKEMRRLPR